jgi:hypothetical protein
MALEIDTSRALRSHAQLTELVAAVVRANPGEQETYALEWKSSPAIETDREARFKLGKQVIGFANRHPDEAAKTFDGCGYILIGAAAGAETVGIERHDAAKLWDWIGPYVGTDGPVWKGDYVMIGERSVLVIIVEPPRWGDPIHLLRKEYGSHREGTPFIRRPGMTVQADVGDMRMLEQRAKRSNGHARLEVEFDGPTPTLDSYRTLPEEWPQWGREEMLRLMRPLEQHRGVAPALGTLTNRLSLENRSEARFTQEVERYVGNARSVWQRHIWDEVVEQRLAVLELLVTNRTDENYKDIEVVLTVPGGVAAFTDDDDPEHVADAPAPPEEWGSPDILRPLAVNLEGVRPIGYRRAKVEIGDRWTVTLPAGDIRPHESIPLPVVYLAISHAFTDGEIDVEWSLTSKSASGRPRGALTAPVRRDGLLITVREPATA